MKRTIILFILFFIIFTNQTSAIVPTPVQSTKSATATSSAEENLKDSTENLGDDIQKIRDVVKLKVQEKLKDITNSEQDNIPQKKSIIGTIIQIDSKQLVIDYKNNTRSITIADDATIIDIKRNKTKLENLKVGQEVMVMGYQENNIFTAKRIVISDLKATILKDQITIGKVADVSKTSSVIVVIPIKNKNSQFQIKIDSKTEIVDKNSKKITYKDIINGQKIIAVIKPESDKSKTYIASKLFVLDSISSASKKQ